MVFVNTCLETVQIKNGRLMCRFYKIKFVT